LPLSFIAAIFSINAQEINGASQRDLSHIYRIICQFPRPTTNLPASERWLTSRNSFDDTFCIFNVSWSCRKEYHPLGCSWHGGNYFSDRGGENKLGRYSSPRKVTARRKAPTHG